MPTEVNGRLSTDISEQWIRPHVLRDVTRSRLVELLQITL